MRKQTKDIITVLIIVFICLFAHNVIGQDKALLELDAGNNKMYLHDPETGKHIEVFRDTSDNGKLGKLYLYKLDKENKPVKWYGIFQHTPEIVRFDYVFNIPDELNLITKQ